MSRILPILFNTDMVQAILDGRKTATRRAIKGDVVGILSSPYHQEHPRVPDKMLLEKLCKAPCHSGDILYVRETWFKYAGEYIYKASAERPELWSGMWHPSIHMPKKAARIWLKVTDVRVEKLHDITDEQILKEGIAKEAVKHYMAQFPEDAEEWVHAAHWLPFSDLWNSTVKKDFDLYSWDANPWVWVIDFEQCEKPAEN